MEAKVNVRATGDFLIGCNLHGACGGKDLAGVGFDGVVQLQSARGVWRQSSMSSAISSGIGVAICTGRVEAKALSRRSIAAFSRCNLHGACGGKADTLYL